jgi:Protein of unknown function (DUF2934)
MAPQATKFHQEANRYDELAQNATTDRMRLHLLRIADHYRSIAKGLEPLAAAPPRPPAMGPPATGTVISFDRRPLPRPAAAKPRRAPAPSNAAGEADGHERRVRERAYAIWEREGRPHGRDRDHWFAAERELAADR